MISCRGIGVDVEGRTILEGITLDIGRGEFVAVLGANGAGKTTLFRVLGAQVRPTRGRLFLLGHEARDAGTSMRARIGMVGHQTMLYRDLTALENLTFFAKLYRVTDSVQRAMEMLEILSAEECAHKRVGVLSRGEGQRVAIARALLHRPELLLFDEPFTGLDARASERLECLLRALSGRGVTVMMSHHDVRHALRIADRATVLCRGRLALDAPVGVLEPDAVAHAMEQEA
jgi:ABC-type multidrug transport system ATPase subunit